MPFIQFRIHPSVGIARMGDSEKSYYLASEFPQFMQEEFEHLRLKPRPRNHPVKFFGGDATLASASTTLAFFTGALPAGFGGIYDPTASHQNRFKDTSGKIFSQAARFRIFAYVYDSLEAPHPATVFEVTAAEAEIKWTVNIANKKSEKAPPPAPPLNRDENMTATATTLDTASPTFTCQRLRPKAGLPNLGYLFLERDDNNVSKVTGRLHVIGNEGEFKGSRDPGTIPPDRTLLWSDDWYDSAADGSVDAEIRPKNGGALLRARISPTPTENQTKYLDHDAPDPRDGSFAMIKPTPAWVVVGCPDYSPDMAHFVSLWDIALSQAVFNLDPTNPERTKVVAQPGKHKLIRVQTDTESFKRADYYVHIHPHLCLFKDVRFVSGEAYGHRERDQAPKVLDRAHNKPPPDSEPIAPVSRATRITYGGINLDARAKNADLADAKMLKDKDQNKPIDEWVKIAIFARLRHPKNVYGRRKFQTDELGVGETFRRDVFPRKVGRRIDYDSTDPASDKLKYYDVPTSILDQHAGSLRDYHGKLDAPGKLCGGKKSPAKLKPGKSHPKYPGNVYNDDRLALLDDLFWPASFADMPMLRELAFTHLQYNQFLAWQGKPGDKRYVETAIFDRIVSPGLKASFAVATPTGDADPHFAKFLIERPLYAPAMIDMAHLGSMIGGSFIPGIEVGREGAIAKNWSLFHGATRDFPDMRFKFSHKTTGHTLGTLTKDLAVPWSNDFARCDEEFWPTARPGMVMTPHGINRVPWLIEQTDVLPHLGRKPTNEAEYVKEYWKALGFVRRNASNQFVEEEQTWRATPPALPAVDITLTDTGASDANATTYTFTAKAIGVAASDRIVVVAVTTRGNAVAVKINSLTVAGTAATERVSIVNGNTEVAIWTVPFDSGATGDVVVKTSGMAARCGVSIYRMVGAPSATPFRVLRTDRGDPMSALIAVPAKGGAIGVAYTNAASTFTWTGLTADADFNAGGEAWRHSSAHSNFAPVQPALTVTADPTAASAQAMVVASWGWWT